MNIIDTIISIHSKVIVKPLSGSFKGLSSARVILEIIIIIVMTWSKYSVVTIRPSNILKKLLGPNIKRDVP